MYQNPRPQTLDYFGIYKKIAEGRRTGTFTVVTKKYLKTGEGKSAVISEVFTEEFDTSKSAKVSTIDKNWNDNGKEEPTIKVKTKKYKNDQNPSEGVIANPRYKADWIYFPSVMLCGRREEVEDFMIASIVKHILWPFFTVNGTKQTTVYVNASNAIMGVLVSTAFGPGTSLPTTKDQNVLNFPELKLSVVKETTYIPSFLSKISQIMDDVNAQNKSEQELGEKVLNVVFTEANLYDYSQKSIGKFVQELTTLKIAASEGEKVDAVATIRYHNLIIKSAGKQPIVNDGFANKEKRISGLSIDNLSNNWIAIVDQAVSNGKWVRIKSASNSLKYIFAVESKAAKAGTKVKSIPTTLYDVASQNTRAAIASLTPAEANAITKLFKNTIFSTVPKTTKGVVRYTGYEVAIKLMEDLGSGMVNVSLAQDIRKALDYALRTPRGNKRASSKTSNDLSQSHEIRTENFNPQNQYQTLVNQSSPLVFQR